MHMEIIEGFKNVDQPRIFLIWILAAGQSAEIQQLGGMSQNWGELTVKSCKKKSVFSKLKEGNKNNRQMFLIVQRQPCISRCGDFKFLTQTEGLRAQIFCLHSLPQ